MAEGSATRVAKRSEIWRRDVVDSVVAKRRAELGGIASTHGAGAAWAEAARRSPRGRRKLTPTEELSSFADAAAGLALAAEQGSRERTPYFLRRAKAILKAAGIGERRSRLSSLHQELESHRLVAEHTAAGANAVVFSDASWDQALERAVHLRTEDAARAAPLQLLDTELERVAESRPLRLAHARIARLGGRLLVARSLLETLGEEPSLREEVLWERACIAAQEGRGLDDLLRLLRVRDVARTPERLLVAHLWAHAAGSKEWMRGVPRATSIERSSRGSPIDALALRAALALDEAYRAGIPVASRVARMLRAANALDDAGSVELTLLALAGTARWLMRAKQREAKGVVARYAALSSSLSGGAAADVLGLALSAPAVEAPSALEAPSRAVLPRELAIAHAGLSIALSTLRARGGGRSDEDRLLEYAEIFAEHASVLRGTVMKLGQVLSFYGFDLPDEAQAVLATLQDAAEPVPFDVVRRIVESGLDKPLNRVFRGFEEVPLAAGSIGQVHGAVLRDGTRVVVKVQYPGIAATIRRDFRCLRVLTPLIGAILPEWDVRGIIDEVAAGVLSECDYRHEAEAHEWFRTRLADDPHVVVPRAHQTLTSARVLVTDRFDGSSFAAFAKEAPQDARNRAAKTIVRYVVRTGAVERRFNTDLQPGNLLFSDDRVCFVDFGSVRTWTGAEADGWRVILTSLIRGDVDELARGVAMIGLADPAGAFEPAALHDFLANHLMRAVTEDRPQAIDKRVVMREIAHLGPQGRARQLGLRIPPVYAYGFRLYWGMFAVGADLGAVANWRQTCLEVLEGMQ
jgi:predicted unusual protein kinase regulating ubiquinone biosynthesis (AarF/ABC1/UbiB family)